MTIGAQQTTPLELGDTAAYGLSVQKVTRQALILLVFLLVCGPLGVLLLTSFSPPGTMSYGSFSFSTANYENIFSQLGTARLLFNTFVYAACSVAVGVTVAGMLAWMTERTDLPGRTVIRVLMFSWMAIPPLVFGYGWILLINPGNGVINVALRGLFGTAAPTITPYSFTAMILISGLSLVPTGFVMISGLLRNMDPVLEDAAKVLGAGRRKIARRVTLPLLSPGLFSIGIFLTMAMVQTFDLPLILGTTAQVPVLSTRIFLLAAPDSGVPNYGLASAFGIFLLCFAVLLMLSYFRAIRASERFRTVSGKGFRPKKAKLGTQKIPAVIAVSLYFAVMLMPLLIVLWTSLFPFYRVPTLADLGQASFDAYRHVLSDTMVIRAILNTIVVVLVSATLVVMLSCLVSWFSVRSKGIGGRLLDIMAFSPMAVPAIVMAIAFLLVFLGTPLYGTIWVLVVGYMTIYLAFGTRTLNGALIQIHKELEDAATVHGASWGTGLRLIVFPIIWPHLLNTWLWVVAHSARDLTFPLILLTSTNVVASSSIYLIWEQPNQPQAASLSMMMVGALLALVIPIQIYITRKLDRFG